MIQFDPMANLAPLILKQIEGQSVSHIRERGHEVIYDETVLPKMVESKDWTVSCTDQWDKRELRNLHNIQGVELGKIFAKLDPWLQMAATAEFAMHGEDEKAREFIQTLFQDTPEAENNLTTYFGEDVMEALKAESKNRPEA